MCKDKWINVKLYARGLTIYTSVFAFAWSTLSAVITPVDSLSWLLTHTVLPTSVFVMCMVSVIVACHVHPELLKRVSKDRKGIARMLPDLTVIDREIYDMGVFDEWYESL